MAILSNRLNPFPFYEEMRKHHPVIRDPQSGVWSVYRYDDVQTVLSDYTRFYSGDGVNDRSDMGPGASIIGMNPPEHRKMRELVSRAFTPRSVQNMALRIHALIEELLEARVYDRKFDVVADLAYPLPVIVIAEMLGIPTENRAEFKRWSDMIVSGTDHEESGYEGTMAMNAYFEDIVQNRRLCLGTDLISSLIEAEVDGEKLTDSEIISFCDLLLVAGNETTTNLLTNAIWTVLDYPEAWLQLVEHPETIPLAIEEVLRFHSPVQAMFRSAATDVRWDDGTTMAPGETVIAWIGSANRDEQKFVDANTFNMFRNPNQNIAFGHGIHYCLGAPLARLETRLALEELVARGIRGFQALLPREEWEPVGGFIVHGVKRLPVEISTNSWI